MIGLGLSGVLVALGWLILVLPALSIAGPMPGLKLAAYLVLLGPPTLSSALMLAAGVSGFRGHAPIIQLRNRVIGAVFLLGGVAGAVYCVLLVRGMF